TKHRTKDGQIRNVLVNSKLVSVGEKNFVQSIWTDITGIKKSEKAVKLMALFPEFNPSPVLRFNRDGEVLMANPASLKTFGRESLTGVLLKSVLPGIEELDLASCIRNGTILSYPIHIGSRFFHFTLRGVPELDIGQVYGDDITELRQAEDALIKNEERYRRITEAITDYIYSVHIEEGRPVNTVHGENCLAITGYTSEELSEDPYLWIHMVLEEDHELLLQQVEDVLAGNFSQSIQHRILRKDGEIRWVESMMVPSYDFNGNLTSYDGLIRDITTRKKLEEQLVHAQKMESIGTLAGGVAHDFNNILTAIIGFSSILTRKIPEDNPSRFYVDQIQMAAESAANLTGSLLAFGRKQRINPMPLNINVLIKKIEKLLSRLIREDIDFRTVLLDDNLNIMADFNQMQQVLMNLVSNARDAMPEGGLLLLTSESFRIDNKFVSSHGFGKPGMYALIAISDTGIGIDEISREKIFEPFYTSKETDKGTGLGLSIVYGIVKEHKGYIEVDSELDKGTTVKIYLPMIETGKDKSIEQIEDVIPRGGRETVLLVEDNSMIRQFLVSELTEFGYRLIVAEDGEEAINKFMEHKDDIQFLITDVIMPNKNGKEVYAAIKKARPGIKALFLSGYSEEMLYDASAFLKGTNFMSKPVKPYDLLRKIREILDSDK
ncbi:MAG: PAS domain S-box protein, partial [Thermodesulfovibrionia bacterium]|nr:PAS domain S-box protein [Thermodesulfovibrionia bacterium]